MTKQFVEFKQKNCEIVFEITILQPNGHPFTTMDEWIIVNKISQLANCIRSTVQSIDSLKH